MWIDVEETVEEDFLQERMEIPRPSRCVRARNQRSTTL